MKKHTLLREYTRTFLLWGFFLRDTYHKSKNIVRTDGYVIISLFGIVQGILFTLLASVFFLAVMVPYIRDEGSKLQTALDHANFSYIKIQDGTLQSDIKPQIFSFYVENEPTHQVALVIDTTGKMNPYFWSDRQTVERTTTVDGFGLLKNSVLLKNGDNKLYFDYKFVFGNQDIALYKSDVDNLTTTVLSPETLVRAWLLIVPLLFATFFLLGVIGHFIFSYFVGFILSIIMFGKTEKWKMISRIALVVYIQYIYFFLIASTVCVLLIPFMYLKFALIFIKVVLLLAFMGLVVYLVKHDTVDDHKVFHYLKRTKKEKNEPRKHVSQKGS